MLHLLLPRPPPLAAAPLSAVSLACLFRRSQSWDRAARRLFRAASHVVTCASGSSASSHGFRLVAFLHRTWPGCLEGRFPCPAPTAGQPGGIHVRCLHTELPRTAAAGLLWTTAGRSRGAVWVEGGSDHSLHHLCHLGTPGPSSCTSEFFYPSWTCPGCQYPRNSSRFSCEEVRK